MIDSMRGGMRSMDRARAPALIKVIGVGGGGCNTVRRMMRNQRIPGVEYIVANTDVKSLDLVNGALSLQIGEHLTHGFGAGGDPKVGCRAAEEADFLLKRALKDAELVFVTVGMGGGTGTGAAPVVAATARESGALVLAVVTTPFSFEGRKRFDVAMDGVGRLKSMVDNMIVVHNDRLLQYSDHDASISQAFSMADEVVSEGILSVSQLVNVPGEINVDLADVKGVMRLQGTAIMAMGTGEGAHPAMDAAEKAISNPLLDVTMKGARGLLVSFSGGLDLSLGEVNEAATLVAREAHPECNFKFGLASLSEELRGKAKVTLIATGIRSSGAGPAPSSSSSHAAATPSRTASSAGKWFSNLGDKLNKATSRW
jgi:cell division protein FtsZ